MSMVIRTPPQKPDPYSAEGVQQAFREYRNANEKNLLCSNPNCVGMPKCKVSIDTLDRATAGIFEQLRTLARTGVLSCTYRVEKKTSPFKELSSEDLCATLWIVTEVFQSTMKFILAVPNPKNGHGHYCNETINQYSVWELGIAWEPNNPYVNPKPRLALPVPSLGETLEGFQQKERGTDLNLVLGQHSFYVHSLIARAFSGLVEKELAEDKQKLSLLDAPGYQFSFAEMQGLVKFMYTRDIDLSKYSDATVIKFFTLSYVLEAPSLRAFTFNYLSQKAGELSLDDQLSLLCFQIEQPFPELNELCGWILRMAPHFETLIDENALDNLEKVHSLMRLAIVTKRHKLTSVQTKFKAFWHRVSLEMKVALAKEALSLDSLFGLGVMAKLCGNTLDKLDTEKDPLIGKLFEHSLQLHEKIQAKRQDLMQAKVAQTPS